MEYSGKKFPLIEKDGMCLLRLSDVLQAEDMEVFKAYEAAHVASSGTYLSLQVGEKKLKRRIYDLYLSVGKHDSDSAIPAFQTRALRLSLLRRKKNL